MRCRISSRLPKIAIGFSFLALAGLPWLRHDFHGRAADAPAVPAAPAKADVYDADPKHLWNRLYAAFYLKPAQEKGEDIGIDELDLLSLDGKNYPMSKTVLKEADALLDEFLAKNGEKSIDDPLKRALFQHDLWAVFDCLAYPWFPTIEESKKVLAERREMLKRLAKVIRRLSLSPEQIEKIPDNYAAAAASQVFPPQRDPKKPAPFLPPKLLEPDGEWVLLGDDRGNVMTPEHVRFFEGRSVFLPFMSLLDGRQATLDYLKKVRGMKPYLKNAKGEEVWNDDLPGFPVGTRVALVRQMLLIDNEGAIRPARITLSVRLRFYRQNERGGNYHPKEAQEYYEFKLRRKELFAGKTGGLHAVGPEEKEQAFFLFMGGNLGKGPTEILGTCFNCHSILREGMGAVNSYNRRFTHLGNPPDLIDSNRRSENLVVINWKLQQESWRLLQDLMKE